MSLKYYKIPEVGVGKKDVLAQLEQLKGSDPDWLNGKTWSLVYYVDDSHYDLMKKAYTMFFSENGLNPMAFKSLKNMERDVVKMTINLQNGNDKCVGTMTSGGTESILLAIKTYRDRARKLKPWIRKPEVIVPESVHVAFNKAGEYFDVKFVTAKLDDDFRVCLKDVKRKINRNTILLVGSAPQYVQGVVDPISELGELALKHNLPLHVDACVGGFMLPWVERLGYDIPLWDYRVPGVTSISADLHKYGFAAKGASTLTYRSMDFMKYQFFVYENWSGGVYASATMPGTRPGGAIAAAWAAMISLGEAGYLKQAKKIMDTVEQFKTALQSIPEIEIVGKPHATVLAWKSNDLNVTSYAIADFLVSKGWSIDRHQKPESIHMTVNPTHAAVIDQYVQDIKDAIVYIRANPKANSSGEAAMYGMMAKIPFRSMIRSSVLKIMQQMYSGDGEVNLEKEKPENIGDVLEKAGAQALEVKRQFDVVLKKGASYLWRSKK
jgi:glutamate/tyrosine decarboxylase-like PLP-dependent enzyme